MSPVGMWFTLNGRRSGGGFLSYLLTSETLTIAWSHKSHPNQAEQNYIPVMITTLNKLLAAVMP